MKGTLKKRKLKYGSVSLCLTVAVVAAVAVFNMIASALAARYEWLYLDMRSPTVYEISDACEEYLKDCIIPEVDKINSELLANEQEALKLEVVFCDTENNIKKDSSIKYVYDSVCELSDIFEGYIDISHLNVWEEPSEAKKYGVSSTSDVICKFNGRYETMSITDFYVFDTEDTTSAVAYNGEKIIASCLMRITRDTPMCYFTANHGERFNDQGLMRAIVEAGYTIGFLDTSKEDIPDDCELLITFEPSKDMVAEDAGSAVSETDKLREYMNGGGRYIVLASADTFGNGGFENFEIFLSEWGVKYAHESGTDGAENTYLIKDPSNSLTVDGYTVLSENARSGIGANFFENSSYTNAFRNSTCIFFAESFKSDGEGNYVFDTGEAQRTVAPLLVSHSGAQAWAGGRAVLRADETSPFVLMSVTEQKCSNGKTAYLIASASSDLVCEELMQSSVLGNSRAIAEIIRGMGKSDVPYKLGVKPFSGTEIESLTTLTANTVTVILTVVPAFTVLAIGTVVLIRRRNR